jgi:hypothetical protein
MNMKIEDIEKAAIETAKRHVMISRKCLNLPMVLWLVQNGALIACGMMQKNNHAGIHGTLHRLVMTGLTHL